MECDKYNQQLHGNKLSKFCVVSHDTQNPKTISTTNVTSCSDYKKNGKYTFFEIAKKLRSEDFKQLKFLCGEKIPRKVLRLTTTSIELLTRLHRMGQITL